MEAPIVVIESPYSGGHAKNVEYAQACMLDSIHRGEAPFASHLLYTQVLLDEKEYDRNLGIYLGLQFHGVADLVAFYTDFGYSRGMQNAWTFAKTLGVPVEERKLK